MNDSEFLKVIEADPANPVPRLVYADWLDEQGNPRGEQLRIQEELRHIDVPNREAKESRMHELLRAGVEPLVITRTNSLGMQEVLMFPGEFLMGSPPSEAGHSENENQVEVRLTPGFWLGRYAVTQAEWQEIRGRQPWQEGFVQNNPGKVSTTVLLQAWCHFLLRDSLNSRAFFPKGNAAKVQFKEGGLPPLEEGIAEAAADGIRRQLVERFSQLPSLGKVFIDEQLRHQFVPFSQRSASRSLRSIARGSSFDLPDGDTVRFFCWWKNLNESDDDWYARVDLDLSASLFNDRWETSGDIAYYNLRQGDCYHSGDITSAPKGACEFIDISLSSVLAMKARYIVMSMLSFTGQPFLSLPECFGGWMMRQQPNSGEVFEPKTVQDKIDITASTRACVPVIIDAQDRRVYWADLGLKSTMQINNAARNCVGFSQIGRSIIELKKPTLFDLFQMHSEARGRIINLPDQAETVFGLHEGTVTAFDTSIVLSEYLT